jgi:pyruvate carboxylase
MMRLERVLIANRGEIAIRIAKAASGLGMESVAVYAPLDALSLHTRLTTEAREIGGAKGQNGDPVRAYLDTDALIKTARASGCDCIHPGYGFLSESAAFAERCASEGLRFVGPTPEALSLFGDKIRARALASSLGIPVVPGSHEALRSATEAQALARALGYPVLLKASAGGGGRGMRRVARPEEMAEAFERCRSQAEAAFGDGALFVKRLVARPRHIEVQILADAQGGAIHLFERDSGTRRWWRWRRPPRWTRHCASGSSGTRSCWPGRRGTRTRAPWSSSWFRRPVSTSSSSATRASRWSTRSPSR